MKRIYSILILLSLCVAARAGSLVTATLTVTNTPADGDTFVVNGDTRTWKTTVATPSSQVVIGASIGANATNMFSHVASYGFTTLTLNRSGTNGITLRGIVDQTITVSLTGTWGTYTLTTNTTTSQKQVAVPASSYPTGSEATNIISSLVSDISTYSTNSIAETATALTLFVNETQTQTVGNKTLTNSVLDGGTITNMTAGFTNLYATNIYAFGPLRLTNTAPALFLYDSDAAADEKSTVITVYSGEFTVESVNDANSASEQILSVGRTGYVVDHVLFPAGEVQITEGLQNTGTTELQRANHTALANGNNAGVNFGAYTFIKIKAGPTAAFVVNGIANGENGKVYILYNSTGQNMTIANDSGVDATPANRIYTGTGGDIATTGNGVVSLIYDSEDSRWIVTSIRD